MAWNGESRRHSLARKGVSTVIEGDRRLAVNKFMARGTFKIEDFKYGGQAYFNEEDPDPENEDPLMTELGFSGTGTGFGAYADIYYYEGKPAVAYHFDGSRLDGFEIHPDFRGKRIFKLFIDDFISEHDGVLGITDPTDEALAFFRRHYEVEYNPETYYGVLRVKGK